MSALDMVMQRQVPARPAARPGEMAGDGRADAFSAALSQEKRSAGADRDQPVATDEAEAARSGNDDAMGEQSAQSEEILDLLAGLMSSASYAKDAAVGQASPDTEQTALAPAEAPGETLLDPEAAADEVAAAIAAAAAQGKPASDTKALGAKAADTVAAAADAVETDAVVRTAAAGQAADRAGIVKQEAGVVASDPRAATAAAGGSAVAAQATVQPVSRQTTTDTAPERQKDQASVREVLRTLGIEGQAQARDAEAGKRDLRNGNGGQQRDVADRRLDDAMSAKGGKVEVVESRKFIPAQNMSANAQALTRTLAEVGSTAIAAQKAAPAQQLAQTGQPQPGQTLHTLKLQLNPASLGSVTAVLKLTGEDLSVEIKVQTAEAYRQIKEDNQSMLKALRAQGFGVEQITVQHVAGSDRASSQAPQQGFQSSPQGTGSNDAQSSGRESGRNNTGQQGAGSQGGQAYEQGSYSGPGTGRTDGVYL